MNVFPPQELSVRTDYHSVRDMADWQDHHNQRNAAAMLRQLYNEREAALRKIKILETPPCLTCGVKVTEECPMGLDSPCRRNNTDHGSRAAIVL